MTTVKKFKAAGVLGGSMLAAITSSLCCIGPLVAGALGAGGFAGSALFEKWRPWFLLLTFASLAWAWYLTYRKPLAWSKAALWVVTGFVLIAAAFPVVSSAFSRGHGQACCAAAAATGGKDAKNQTGVEPSIPKETR
jgi:hypothetical protein